MKKQRFARLKSWWRNRTFFRNWGRQHTVAWCLLGLVVFALGLGAVSGGEDTHEAEKGSLTADEYRASFTSRYLPMLKAGCSACSIFTYTTNPPTHAIIQCPSCKDKEADQNKVNEAFCHHEWMHIPAQDQCTSCGVLSGPVVPEEDEVSEYWPGGEPIYGEIWINESPTGSIIWQEEYVIDATPEKIKCECVWFIVGQPAGIEPKKTLITRCKMCIENEIKVIEKAILNLENTILILRSGGGVTKRRQTSEPLFTSEL